MTPHELSDPVKCKEKFDTKVQEREKELLTTVTKAKAQESETEGEIPVWRHYHDIVRFCELLGYSEDQLFGDVALAAAKDGQLSLAREICR